jgi:hypothetical protein
VIDPDTPFDRNNAKIAITMPRFTLLRRRDGIFQKRNEPYVVSVAVDAAQNQANPSIDFNALPFPNVVAGDEIRMLGHGHLFYGPRHPGAWVALSVLFMESDQDLRDLGTRVNRVVQSKATDLAMKTVLAAKPGFGPVIGLLKELTQLVAAELQSNKDDELFRTHGIFLRDHPAPFDINRVYHRSNEFIEAEIKVTPLDAPNGQGSMIQSLTL